MVELKSFFSQFSVDDGLHVVERIAIEHIFLVVSFLLGNEARTFVLKR